MSVDELKKRVAELESALAAATGGSVGGGREKIVARWWTATPTAG